MNKYIFFAEIRGVSLGEEVDFAGISPLLRNVKLQQGSRSEIQIEISKSRTWPEDVAFREAELEVDELLDRLSLIDNHQVICVQYVGFRDHQGTMHARQDNRQTRASLTAVLADPKSYYEDSTQKKILSARTNPGLTRLHRTAQGMPNGIGKFLLLYGALQIMHGETQVKIDEYLMTQRNDILVTHGKHRNQTVITRIRNQIAHPENDIDVQSLARQAELYCPMLGELVRESIIQQMY